MPLEIIFFILIHWYLAAACQTLFLHRYASHGQFFMTPAWEKIFYVLTWVSQGSSYLNPRAYALMHRMHHAYSDTEQDPHSPLFSKNPARMMMQTLRVYLAVHNRSMRVPDRFEGGYPAWPAFDRWADLLAVRLLWAAGYTAFYIRFADAPWQYAILPIHIFMGPIHGAIVNWCGHRYGYVNFENGDQSRNTFCADLLTMGELMQNNHHHDTANANFSRRWYEWDPAYALLRALQGLKIIRLESSVQKVR